MSTATPLMKFALAVLVVLMGAVFFWQPLQMVLSKASITNDFVLQAADGPLDTKRLRGKVLAIVFGYADCGDRCADRLGKLAKAYGLLNPAERSQVVPVLISVDPEHDDPKRIGEYAKKADPTFIGLSGKPDEIKTVADAFAADYRKIESKDGSYVIESKGLIYLVDAEGHFASVLNEIVPPEQIAAAIHQRVPTALPPR